MNFLALALATRRYAPIVMPQSLCAIFYVLYQGFDLDRSEIYMFLLQLAQPIASGTNGQPRSVTMSYLPLSGGCTKPQSVLSKAEFSTHNVFAPVERISYLFICYIALMY